MPDLTWPRPSETPADWDALTEDFASDFEDDDDVMDDFSNDEDSVKSASEPGPARPKVNPAIPSHMSRPCPNI
jgi:hypothetical protein